MSKNKTFSTRKQRKTSAQKTFCRLILTFCFDLSSYQNIQKKTLLAETFYGCLVVHVLFIIQIPREITQW